MTFGELNDSSVPFSFIIPSSDQDMDDVTLGKLLTEAHRGQADYRNPEGVSVSQSSSVVFDRAGKPAGETSINQLVLVSQETRKVLTASFLKTPKMRKWSIDQGNLRSERAQMHRFGLYLKNRDRWLLQNIAKKSVIMNSKQLTQKKTPNSTRRIMASAKGFS